jgi:pimeloyl-ACP methyl ester carboxylesterase
MADIAADYAVALGPAFGEPVDVLGISTGGSVAQQFALDHPRLLRRLVLAGAAHRLGPVAREAQRRSAEFAESGDYRRSLARMGKNWDTLDMIATIRAEDAFDVAGRLGEVRAPTLLIAGDRDLNFGMGLFERTAALIPDCRFVVYGATTAGRKARGGTRTGSGAPGGSYSRPRIRSSAPRSWTAATASLSFGTGPAQRTGRK